MENQKKLSFRLLNADEIDCRINTITENGVSLLLYKDARVDQNILDETVGPMNWQRSHSRENANCIVSIWDDEKKQWVSKEDTGTESYTEKEKGLASDSFKRACFNWGIGRELYTAPMIWIGSDSCKIEKRKEKLVCYDQFRVKEITYDDKRNIKTLVITGKYNKVVFPKKIAEQEDDISEFETDPSKALVQAVHINTLCLEMQRTGVGMKNFLTGMGIEDIHKLTMAQFQEAMEKFKKKPNKSMEPDPSTIPKGEEGGLPWNDPAR